MQLFPFFAGIADYSLDHSHMGLNIFHLDL